MNPTYLNKLSLLLTLVLVVLGGLISVVIYNEFNVSTEKSIKGGMIASQQVWDLVKPAILFGMMLLGMFFNQLFEILQEQKNKGMKTTNMWKNFLRGIRGITFWMAVVVSPIIFFCTFYLVDSDPDNKASYFFAFQNGFFWINIFNKTELKVKKT
jgi:hypothetical protein